MLKKNPAPAGFFFGDERLVLHIRCAGALDGVISQRVAVGLRKVGDG